MSTPTETAPVSHLLKIESRPESLTSKVFNSLRDAIIAKELPPGARLSEAKLASEMGVSKTPIRESLLRLKEIGLAEEVGQRGLRVAKPSRKNIIAHYEVRAGLESLAARLAAQRIDPTEFQALRDAAEQSISCAREHDHEGRRAWDVTFHGILQVAAQNEKLRQSLDDIQALTWVLRQRDIDPVGESIECTQQHRAIAEIICAGEASTAAELMFQHIITIGKLVTDAMVDPVPAGLKTSLAT